MAYEIDFMAVGNASKSGDAIALRIGKLDGQRSDQLVIVIDGGTLESGEALVTHIEKYYGTDTVDLAFATHSDGDHTSGLCVVLEKMNVKNLFMHQPWKHAHNISEMFTDGRVTPKGIATRLKESLQNAHDLEEIANRKKISISEPFSDLSDGTKSLTILGPSLEYYESLLPQFEGLPETIQETGPVNRFMKAAAEAITRAAENWGLETLVEPELNATSASNNSSVILYLKVNGNSILFTADAGVPALVLAAARASQLGITLSRCNFIQVPHHGSKRNIGPSILNQMIGPKLPQELYTKTAFVSAAKEGEPKHPAKKVVNAFKRRGANVYATQGQSLWHHSSDAPARDWKNATPLPFYSEVEE